MKELSIEQKAQRYDEAIERARNIHRNYKGRVRAVDVVIEEVFPELKENDNKRVRIKLIEFFKGYSPDKEWWGNIAKGDILAWLEKQNEQKHVIAPKFNIGDTIRNKITNEVFTITNRCISLEYYHDINHSHEVKFSEQDNWELVKQKPTDKVKPKFKVGDWIVYNRTDYSNEIMQIYDIRDGRYYFNDNIHFSWSIKECDEKSHLWTVKDAKDGDVLCTKNKCCPFIYDKGRYNNGLAYYYAGIDVSGNLNIKSPHNMLAHFGRLDNIRPATQEQRDLLFQKMKEAGCEWDAEKKELKKAEQEENVELTDFESALFSAFSYAWQEYLSGKEVNVAKWAREHSAELLEVAREQNPAWSEEDESINQSIIGILTKQGFQTQVNWLKSLKDRVQPIQEWSEDDESMYIRCLGVLSKCLLGEVPTNIKEEISWLKSLKDRVLSQQEWNEEDKKMLDFAIRAVGLCKQYAINHQVDEYSKLPDVPKRYEELQDWLKSLKQSTATTNRVE